jgi:dTDP-glucose 4,6-dehydratase
VFGDLLLDSKESFSLTTPYNPSSPYSASKAAADHLIRAWVRSFGLRATISNCSNNYGPRQHWEKLIPNTIRTLLSGSKAKVYGAGLNVRDWIHVDDHVDGIWLAIEKGEIGGTYLFGVGDTLTNLMVVNSIVRELSLPESSIEFVADRPGHDLRYSIDASVSNTALGWQPNHVSLINNLPELVAWYRNKFTERIEL